MQENIELTPGLRQLFLEEAPPRSIQQTADSADPFSHMIKILSGLTNGQVLQRRPPRGATVTLYVSGNDTRIARRILQTRLFRTMSSPQLPETFTLLS